jgi:glucokinase
MLIVGDIGGTKTALAVYDPEIGARQPVKKKIYPSGKYASLEAMLKEFVKDVDEHITQACFGVAGPVLDDQARVTNLSWVIQKDSLSQALGGVPVWLLNDLGSIANGIPFLEDSDLETIHDGESVEHGAIAVIAPGTGLGEAFMTWNGTRYQAHPSEGGHVDFAPSGPTQLELLNFMAPRFGHVSYERVCSGTGLPNLYDFLLYSGKYEEPDWLREQIDQTDDPNPVIVKAALEGRAEIAEQTLALFVSILGGEAGNLTLKILATGGVYLGGGIPPRILPQLKAPAFMETFVAKGRFSEILEKVPVHVILHPEAALFGAACYAIEMEHNG